MPNKSQLNLLVPWNLPIDKKLCDRHKIKLAQILDELLGILANPDINYGIVTIEKLIAGLEIYEVFTPENTSTYTNLKFWEVEDYDTYFDVRHIQSHEPEFCLVMGLLLTCQRFLDLSNSENISLDRNQLEMQRQGFIAYIHLLGRIFHLNLSYAEL